MKKGEVSASSILELKAELLKKEQEFKAAKAQKEQADLQQTNGSPRPSKRPFASVAPTTKPFAKHESEAKKKARQDDEAWGKSRAKLEEKARIYELLHRGDDEEVDEQMKEHLLVDFDRKFYEDRALCRLEVTEEAFEEMVEYEDEFGRTRSVRLNEWKRLEEERLSAARLIEQIREEFDQGEDVKEEGARPAHYDDSIEVSRRKGIGFYRFSQAEEERTKQMEELGRLRQDTVDARTRHMILEEQRQLAKEQRLQRIAERRRAAKLDEENKTI